MLKSNKESHQILQGKFDADGISINDFHESYELCDYLFWK